MQLPVEKHLFFELIKVPAEVVLPISLWVVDRRADLPLVSERLSSHVKFKKLLQLVVIAPVSILEPVNSPTFDKKTYDQSNSRQP